MSVCDDCIALEKKWLDRKAGHNCCRLNQFKAPWEGIPDKELPDSCPHAEALRTVTEHPDKYKLVAVPVDAKEKVVEKDCVCGGIYAAWNEHQITWRENTNA